MRTETIPETVRIAPPPAAVPMRADAEHFCAPPAPATIAWFIALLGWTVLLSFYHLDGGADFVMTDCWVAQTAREMRESGDYIVPRFSGEERMQKSPGAYWAVILTSYLRGTPVDEISTRIPNAAAAVLLVATIFWLTRRIAGDRAAVFAGFAAASSAMLLYWSHRGASDLGVTAWMTLSLACLWIALESEPPGWKRNLLLLLGYFAAGVGMLYKMPMPLVCVGLPAFLYVLLRNRWSILANRWHLLGLILFLLPWLPWVIGVYQREGDVLWAKWRTEFVDRATGDLPNVVDQKHWLWRFYYLVPLLVFCLPYSLSLPQALARIYRSKPGVNRNGQFFVFLWFVGLFAFFTIAVGKENRYLLPAIPPLFVLLGIELAAFFDPQRPIRPILDRFGAWAVWLLTPLALGGGAFALHQWQQREDLFTWNEVWPAYAVTAAILFVGLSLAAGFYKRRRENAAFAALVGTMWAFWLWAWPNLLPIVASERSHVEFARALRDQFTPEQKACLKQIAEQDSRVIWYGNLRFPRIVNQLKLLEMQGGRRSQEKERRIIGEEMVKQLAGDELALLVIGRPEYVEFLLEAPAELAKENRSMPPLHVWLQSRVGAKGNQYEQILVIGNRPPPWPEEPLTPPSDRLEKAKPQRAFAMPSRAEPGNG